jgi:hypothetical protein
MAMAGNKIREEFGLQFLGNRKRTVPIAQNSPRSDRVGFDVEVAAALGAVAAYTTQR